MKILVNGEHREFSEHVTISELIKLLGIKTEVMAVAVNMDIVKKNDWDTFKIKENDRVELLQFVGGG